jgi:transcriptional regulator with XRE-family HTH domain
MSNNNYTFTNLTHEQILDIIEQYRVKNNLSKSELARRAGYSTTIYFNLIRKDTNSRFSRKSFNTFMNLCNAETERTLFSAIDKRIEENPNANHIEAAIQLLKSTGKYKILELQQTWNEL